MMQYALCHIYSLHVLVAANTDYDVHSNLLVFMDNIL